MCWTLTMCFQNTEEVKNDSSWGIPQTLVFGVREVWGVNYGSSPALVFAPVGECVASSLYQGELLSVKQTLFRKCTHAARTVCISMAFEVGSYPPYCNEVKVLWDCDLGAYQEIYYRWTASVLIEPSSRKAPPQLVVSYTIYIYLTLLDSHKVPHSQATLGVWLFVCKLILNWKCFGIELVTENSWSR